MIFVIKLETNKEQFYKEFTDYAFRATDQVQEATIFRSQEEAASILKSYGLQLAHPNAFIERIR